MQLRIDTGVVADARRLATEIAAPVTSFIAEHSTVAVERSVLRLLGVDGVCTDDAPVPNRVLERLGAERLAGGAARGIGALVAET
ncbi:MAG: D-lysine 5,6-aminomutase subunit alpha, partial [Candidatus Eremiobacteraeota bacterium]|nr:D-lysine 5,6-aminomutase subunit alpha [Candidatus Eremiobacteraeota bacterium]